MLKLSYPTIGGVSIALALLYLTKALIRRLRKGSVKDKVVLITGASSGTGEACARAFYQAGARVILCARREQELQRVKQELLAMRNDTETHEPYVLSMDVTDFDNLPSKVETAAGFHGRIDILISNSGIGAAGSVLDTGLDVYKDVMDTNFFGQVAIIKATLPHMLKNRGGHIVTMSTLQALFALPYRSVYGSSKHATKAFFDSLRVEMAPHNINVCSICPSYINTAFSYSALSHDGEKLGVKDTNLENGMSAEEVASHVLDAVVYNRDEVLLGPVTHRAAVYLRVLWLSMFTRVMRARSAKEREAMKKVS